MSGKLTILRRALGLLALLAVAGCVSPRPPAVILSTDAGCEVDDQWALAYLLLLHEAGDVDLRAVVTSHAPNLGERPSERSASVARRVLELFDPTSDLPVVPGSSGALAESKDEDDTRGARLIVEESAGFSADNRLIVLTIGAATDVARSILLDPSIADRVEIVAMGFEGWPRGGDPWNVKNDPRAYEVILDSRAPLTIGSAEPCVRHLSLDARKAALVTEGGGPLGDSLRNDLLAWLREQGDACRKWTGRDAWPIWDVITVAHILGWTRWEEHARPRLREDLTFEHGEEPGGHLRWITAVDDGRLWEDFGSRLARHARRD
ncbi:MAG: nucleoside hydrolase [Planctomycetota bacterium]|nr:nucleoside hydrolase [Planctomycetota bacterium]